jgi:hypothetical protein
MCSVKTTEVISPTVNAVRKYLHLQVDRLQSPDLQENRCLCAVCSRSCCIAAFPSSIYNQKLPCVKPWSLVVRRAAATENTNVSFVSGVTLVFRDKLSQSVTLLTYSREVSVSDLGCDADFAGWGVYDFMRPPWANYAWVPLVRPRPLPHHL